MNLTNSTETNSIKTSTDVLAERLGRVNEARSQFDATPLVKVRRSLRGNGQRFATVEQVEAHKAREFGQNSYAAKMDFLTSIREEAGVGLSANELAELNEAARLAEEKKENDRLAAEFVKAVED